MQPFDKNEQIESKQVIWSKENIDTHIILNTVEQVFYNFRVFRNLRNNWQNIRDLDIGERKEKSEKYCFK